MNSALRESERESFFHGIRAVACTMSGAISLSPGQVGNLLATG